MSGKNVNSNVGHFMIFIWSTQKYLSVIPILENEIFDIKENEIFDMTQILRY